MYKYFADALVVNEGRRQHLNVLVCGNRIEAVSKEPLSDLPFGTETIDCRGLMMIPGVIDAHVHFRQPGLEYKADMRSESRAALAGGVTTVLEMPNTKPTTTTVEALEAKLRLAESEMWCNYGFFFGVTNENCGEAVSIPRDKTCGLKLFLGSSTGNMLVDDAETIERLFSSTDKVISAHCEDEKTIKANIAKFKAAYPDPTAATAELHPKIRTSEACFLSSSFAVGLARKHSAHLHLAHITTERELSLLDAGSVTSKRITAEVSPVHLWFSSEDFTRYGNLIKCNPSIKTAKDREALRRAVNEDRIDLIATDHAPHTLEEKQKPYFDAPSGIPSIQHSLLVMLQMAAQNVFTIEKIVEKMCHNPALLFQIEGRGFIKEGYFADFVLIDPTKKTTVLAKNLFSQCAWSPFEGQTFDNKIVATYLNGEKAFENGAFSSEKRAMRI